MKEAKKPFLNNKKGGAYFIYFLTESTRCAHKQGGVRETEGEGLAGSLRSRAPDEGLDPRIMT